MCLQVVEQCEGLRGWQYGVAALLWLPTLSAGLNIMAYTFAGYEPHHTCTSNSCTDSDGWLAHLNQETNTTWLAGVRTGRAS